MDWASPDTRVVNAAGSKACMTAPKSEYSTWRRQVGQGAYATDIDWVEWRTNGGPPHPPRPVAILETTDYDVTIADRLPAYCQSAVDRFKYRDQQYAVVDLVASSLGVPAYYVCVRKDLQRFRVCRLKDEAWKEFSQDQYRDWLLRLGA